MRYYVVADVHGFYSLMKKALYEKGFFSDPQPHKLVVCGDMMDRGEEAASLERFIAELMQEDGVILIRGNHEDLMMSMVAELRQCPDMVKKHHVSNGTLSTALQLCAEKTFSGDIAFPDRIMKTAYCKTLIPAMKNFYETERYIFVHGWIPCRSFGADRRADKFVYHADWRNASEEDWFYARWHNGMKAFSQGVTEKGKTILCGHSHASYGHSRLEGRGSEFGADADFSPFIADGIIALDACTAYSGKLNCVVLEE